MVINAVKDGAEIMREVKERFTAIAVNPGSEKVFPLGINSATKLGYCLPDLVNLPITATESFCGVGYPFSLGRPASGQTVLDLGCGAGLDSILAAQMVGEGGKVIGQDMTEAMIEKARKNVKLAGLSNVEFFLGGAEHIALADASVDIVLSNGLLNLCLDKEAVLSEVFRVLRPGARLQMCDVLLHDEVTEAEVAERGAWSD